MKAFVLASLAALSAAPAFAHGLKVELTRPGFALVSDVARREFLGNLTDATVPDLELNIAPFATVRAQGISYTVKLSRLDVYPGDGELGVDLQIDDIQVNVGSLRFEAYEWPFLGTTCYGMGVDIGKADPLPVALALGAGIGPEGIDLNLRRLDFSLLRDQYRSTGPSDCRGPFNIEDYLTRYVAGAVLSHARPFIEAGVKLGARAIVPKVASTLNALTVKPLVITTPDLIVTKPTSLSLQGRPTVLNLTDDGLELSLDLTVAAAETLDTPLLTPHAPEPSAGALVGQRYATFGVEPALVNEVLAVVLADGSRRIPLTPAMNPMIEQLTDRESLAAFWPDLEKTQSTGDKLKLFARIVKAPVLSALPGGQGWHVAIPDLELHFQLNRDGNWIDYVDLHVKAELDAAPTLQNGRLALHLLRGTASGTSAWAPGYTPVDPTFDAETTNSVLNAVIDLVATSETPPEFSLPALDLAGYALTAQGLKMDAGFATLDLVEAQH